MRISLFLVLLALMTSCKNEFENDPALGAWNHVETMADIGDGNATYQKIESNKSLMFTAYGTVISNKKVCLGNNYSEATVATWISESNEFTVDDCTASYSLNDNGDILTVTYNCMEACGEKFARAD